MNVQTIKPTIICRTRKFSDARLVELHSRGLSIPKLAKELGVSQQPVRKRMCKLGLRANRKRGGVPLYERVGRRAFPLPVLRKGQTLAPTERHHLP